MSRRRRTVLVGLGLVAIVVVGFLAAVHIELDAYAPQSHAMAPTIEKGVRIWARSIDGADVHRGDVVILHLPRGAVIGPVVPIVVSRVVAIAGDRIADTATGKLVVDGRPVDEPYLAGGMRT